MRHTPAVWTFLAQPQKGGRVMDADVSHTPRIIFAISWPFCRAGFFTTHTAITTSVFPMTVTAVMIASITPIMIFSGCPKSCSCSPHDSFHMAVGLMLTRTL
ncbi:hypothetical protein EYF80_013050 [Liparis tanakae]|uniref:Uncharacterized protein n=1 Tax=Liparis tanakae TaxID=230148 RepID=A0A4Z2IGA5_9TELE|nr:hypothetical protein EYF80_013050 [Liparis tanakae]